MQVRVIGCAMMGSQKVPGLLREIDLAMNLQTEGLGVIFDV